MFYYRVDSFKLVKVEVHQNTKFYDNNPNVQKKRFIMKRSMEEERVKERGVREKGLVPGSVVPTDPSQGLS